MELGEVDTAGAHEGVDMVGCHAAVRDFEFVEIRELDESIPGNGLEGGTSVFGWDRKSRI